MIYANESNNHAFGKTWMVNDTCGMVCMVVTWSLLFYGQVVVCLVMMPSVQYFPIHQTIHFIIFEVLLALAVTSHLKSVFTNPGAVPLGNKTNDYIEFLLEDDPDKKIYECVKCLSVKPDRAAHCSVCNRCIQKMDHHCQWVNNCVGLGNQKYFVLFTLYIALLSLEAFYWVIWQFLACLDNDWQYCPLFSPPVITILLMFLLFESVLFSIFTMIMFGTQISAICSDKTGIESLKKTDYRRKNRKRTNMQEVFGGPFGFQWFNPLSTPFKRDKSYQLLV